MKRSSRSNESRPTCAPATLALAALAGLVSLGPTREASAQQRGGAPASTPAPSAPGAGVETFEYTVQPGDTCASIAERHFGDRRRYDILHAFNPGMGPPPHDLVAGTVLRLPRRAPSAAELADATVTDVLRRVEARPRPATEAWIAAQRGLDLYRDGRVQTQTRAAAELTFRDTSVVQLREDTLVIIFGPTASTTRRAGMDATLETGALRTRLGELRGARGPEGNDLRVHAPSGSAELHGGSAVVSVDGGGTARLSNHTSRAALASRTGGRVAVPEGSGSMVRRGTRPSRPRPLPPAPTLAGGPETFVGLTGEGGTLTGAWTPVPSATRYRVEVATRPDGRSVVAAVEVPATVTRFELRELPAGTYYVTLATLDGDLFESAPASPRTMRVVLGELVDADGTPVAHASTASSDATTTVLSASTSDATTSDTSTSDATSTSSDATSTSTSSDASASTRDATTTTSDATTTTSATPRTAADALATHTVHDGARFTLPDGVTCEGAEGGVLVLHAGVTPTCTTSTGDPVALPTIHVAPPPVVAPPVETPTEPAAPDAPAPIAAPAPLAAPAPSAAPEGPRVPRPTELWARSPIVSALTLTDFDRRGHVLGLGVSQLDSTGVTGPRTRLAFTAELSLFDDQLQLGTTIPADIESPHAATWEAGSGDLHAHARWVPLHRDATSVETAAFAVDVGVWIPTHTEDPSGLQVARLTPSVELAYTLERTLSLRTRQGAIVDLSDRGGRLYASAYGIDLHAAELSVGLELDMAVGSEPEASLFAFGLAPGVALALGPATLDLGLRMGLNRDGIALFGPVSVTAGISTSIE